MRRTAKNLICKLIGHKPDKTHGYHNQADFGATCTRCNYKYETYDEFNTRHGII